VNKFFTSIATSASHLIGTPWAFLIAVSVIIIWFISGPMFGFSDTWQLVINTGTTIVTFLTVFLIQNTQNRDAKAIHLKLDAIILSLSKVSNTYIDIEELDDKKLEQIKKSIEKKVNGSKQKPKR
jgi:low affinity Fe/Cu permease